jgi:hypothetical protein
MITINTVDRLLIILYSTTHAINTVCARYAINNTPKDNCPIITFIFEGE